MCHDWKCLTDVMSLGTSGETFKAAHGALLQLLNALCFSSVQSSEQGIQDNTEFEGQLGYVQYRYVSCQ